MSTSKDGSPRTAAVLAKQRAAAILRKTEEVAKAIKVDKEWDEDTRRRERARVDKDRSLSERIANRQQEVRSASSLRIVALALECL